jgi:hypothetical protein
MQKEQINLMMSYECKASGCLPQATRCFVGDERLAACSVKQMANQDQFSYLS